MQGVLGRQSIRNTLRLVLLVTSLSALALATVGFAINDWHSARAQLYDQLQSEAKIIGQNTVAALMFDDGEAATRTLASLRGEDNIVSAALFRQDGKLLARYQRDDESVSLVIPPLRRGEHEGYVYVLESIQYDGEHLGKILLWSDHSDWKNHQFYRLATLFALFLISLMVSFLISNKLQRLVTDPVLELADTARQVTRRRDYSLRANKLSKDEIGSLVDDFNDMLQQIEQRDVELKEIQGGLEDKILSRTKELEELAARFEYLAYHDNLTGLANRITFDNRLSESISHMKRHGGRLSVLFLDLDRFKVINDTLGHNVGDQLLIEVARRLSHCLRDEDTLARLGGDEFSILLEDISPGNVAEVATKVIDAVSQPLWILGHRLQVTTSVGVSVYPQDGDVGEVLLKNADMAMYRSKEKGRNRFTFFAADMNDQVERRLALESSLRQTLQRGRLFIHYQPKCHSNDLSIMGVEALVRWEDEVLGPVSPAEFIPLAEDCGLIDEIDLWVLHRACQDIQILNQQLKQPIQLSVNFSPVHFARKKIYQEVKAVLDDTGFDGKCLELEITESLIGPDVEDVYQELVAIHQLGVEISIDDFGTAYSSLSRLKALPLDTLKIDRSFIKDLGRDIDDETLVRTIITMAHNLNMKVVAEGVETEEQFEFVKRYDCDTIQGFLYSRPVSFDQLLILMRERSPDVWKKEE